MSERAEELAAQLHEKLLALIVERILLRVKRGESYRLTAVDKWALETLRDAGYLRADLEREIAEATRLTRQEISRAFEDACVRAVAWDDEIYKAAGLAPTEPRRSPYFLRLARRGYEKTCGEWVNFTGTLADSAQQLFIRECDKAYNLVASGAVSYSQAIREAVETVAQEGVTVTYPSGHRDTVETATARAVRTGVGQACGEITLARMEGLQWEIVLVSAHLGAWTGDGGENFTNHYWLQGKFYSRTGEDKRFPPLSVCGIGLVDGLLGVNCRHSIGPGDGEFNPFERFDSEANREREELDKKQRSLERQIRAARREAATAQHAVEAAPDEATKAEMEQIYRKKAATLQKREAAYDAFCEANDRRKLYERLDTAGFGPRQARAAEKAARETNLVAENRSGFTKNKIADIMQGERVPNSITAATPQQKLQGYLLNSNHPRGKEKARVFNSVLGYHYENWDKLSDKIFDGLQRSSVASVEHTRYGIKYKVPMRIVGERGKSMVVNTVWQLDTGATVTRLVTATFDKRTIRKEARDAEIV